MNNPFEKTLSVRFIVFEPDDIVEAFKMLIASVKNADLHQGSSGITTMKLPRTARWSISGDFQYPAHKQNEVRPAQPLEPFMLHIWCAFSARKQLLEDLRAAQNSVRFRFEQINAKRLEHGILGAVPHLQSSSVSGEWQVTAVHVEPPRGLFWT